MKRDGDFYLELLKTKGRMNAKEYLPLIWYLNEKEDMGLVGDSGLTYAIPDEKGARLVKIVRVRPKIWDKVIKPGMELYVNILEWYVLPSVVNKYWDVDVLVELKNDIQRKD